MKLYMMEEKNEVTYKGVFVLETNFSTIASLFEVKKLIKKIVLQIKRMNLITCSGIFTWMRLILFLRSISILRFVIVNIKCLSKTSNVLLEMFI